MALPVLIDGPSAAGKTYSLKGFADTPDRIGVISVEKGRLPFKSQIKTVRVPEVFRDAKTPAQVHAARYAWLKKIIGTARCKAVVIDDSQYLLVNELFDRAREKGYEKFTEMAANFRDLIHYISHLPEEDKIVYFLHHSELDVDGRAKAKTVGKMLDEKLVLEGCFDIVIYCQNHRFFTQSAGMSTAKTPEGMFADVEIGNDLKMVDDAIRTFYGM